MIFRSLAWLTSDSWKEHSCVFGALETGNDTWIMVESIQRRITASNTIPFELDKTDTVWYSESVRWNLADRNGKMHPPSFSDRVPRLSRTLRYVLERSSLPHTQAQVSKWGLLGITHSWLSFRTCFSFCSRFLDITFWLCDAIRRFELSNIQSSYAVCCESRIRVWPPSSYLYPR